MNYAKILNNKVTDVFDTLPQTYVLENGDTVCGFNHLSNDDLIALASIYPVVDMTPAFNADYQYIDSPVFTVHENYVSVLKTLKDIKPTSQHIEQRLADFAKQKDIDIAEIGLLLQSDNVTWQQEAMTFATVYETTWQAFYDYTGESWQELELTLPILSW